MKALTLLLTALFSSVPIAWSQDGAEEVPVAERFEALVAADDMDGVDLLLNENRWEVIFLVDGYLEAWLMQWEMPEAERVPNPDDLLELARVSGRRADKLFGGDAYNRYVEAWAGWSQEERVAFRRGQAVYREARDLQRSKQYAEALDGYRSSLEIARPLGDLWGTAQAEQALGDLANGREEFDVALEHHGRAVKIFGSLRHPRILRSHRAIAYAHERNGDLAETRESLERMLEIAQEIGREVKTGDIYRDLAVVCAELGDEAAAERYLALVPADGDAEGDG